MKILDGVGWAQRREAALRPQITALAEKEVFLGIAAVVFREDVGSMLYTRLKREAAERVGIKYWVHEFSLADPIKQVGERITQLNQDASVTGIIIQKPWRQTWINAQLSAGEDERAQLLSGYQSWWLSLVSFLEIEKDVDGLHPQTLAAVEQGVWKEQGRVLPATAAAVLAVLDEAGVRATHTVCVLGKSDIVGKPLFFELRNRGHQVEMIGSAELRQRKADGVGLADVDVVISATGRAGLITGDFLKPGVILIDVGEPKPDVDRVSVDTIPSLITPVPGGVGPMTVASLLTNCVALVGSRL